MTRQTLVSGLAILAFGAFAVACKAGGVGDPCIPNEEYSPEYRTASLGGADIDERSFQCETRVCLAKNFRGRVTCPFGNPAGGSKYAGPDKECKVPGTEVQVTVDVVPQCADRVGQVYCTCRCDGEDASAKYCDCPEDYVCTEVTNSLSADIGPNDKYCVKKNDTAGDGYECRSLGCDEDPNRCGFTSNTYEF
ncbi:MAG: hypothetical protein MUF54_18150 [Polyangiaceae bacterium]|jgi:hypothetical protein|nr:hypothetical protein [Polyangiaceae bacterium]